MQVDKSGLAFLPTGGTLSDDAFRRRHRTLRVVLGLHVPALVLLAYLRSQTALHLEIAVVPVLIAFLLGGFGDRRTRSLFVSAGLACCSAAVIGLSGGAVESHYHVLVMVGFVALYQDWPPFVGFVSITAFGYAAAAALAPTALFDTPTSDRPYLWAAVHVAFVLAEATAMVVFWRATEQEQGRTTELASTLTKSELVRTREADEQNRASSELLSSLAHRNQILLDRQLERIDALEQMERDPESLAELFSLDHLATRMRRNAESLLVLSGGAGTQAFDMSVPLSEICRGAMAEVEDYARVDVSLVTDVMVNGEVVGDLVHLVAELIENATSFSPPNTRVTVSGNVTSSQGYVLAVTDSGIGMADGELEAANATLADAEGAGVGTSGMLGLRVVARLASRYGVRAWLQRGQRAGLAAMLALPAGALDATAPNLGPVAVDPMDGLFAGSAPPAPLASVPAPAFIPAGESSPDHAYAGAIHGSGAHEESALADDVFSEDLFAEAVFADDVYVESAGHVDEYVAPTLVPSIPETVQPPVPLRVPAMTVTAAGLQKRVPNASLAAPLAADAGDAYAAPRAQVGIAPDRARNVLAAYTGGIQRARQQTQLPAQDRAPVRGTTATAEAADAADNSFAGDDPATVDQLREDAL